MEKRVIIVPATYESLKYFVDSELKIISRPIALSSAQKEDICQKYVLSWPEFNKFMRSLTAYLQKKYTRTFYTRQSKVEVVNQVLNLEQTRSLARQKSLLQMNEMLLVFNHDRLPDLAGGVNTKKADRVQAVVITDEEDEPNSEEAEDAFAVSNVNANGGLMHIKEEQILQLAAELPEVLTIKTRDETLASKYEDVRSSLTEHMARLRAVRQRLALYRELQRRTEFLKEPSRVLASVSTKSAGTMAEVSKAQKLAEKLQQRLRDPKQGAYLRKKIREGLNEVSG